MDRAGAADLEGFFDRALDARVSGQQGRREQRAEDEETGGGVHARERGEPATRGKVTRAVTRPPRQAYALRSRNAFAHAASLKPTSATPSPIRNGRRTRRPLPASSASDSVSFSAG